MKKLIVNSIALMMVCLIAQAQELPFSQRKLEKKLNRDAAKNTGPIPDYNQMYFWAASPYKHDCSDSIPAFLKEEMRSGNVDVFFIHPTSFTANMKTSAWNADLNDTVLNNRTDMRSVLYQASVFNGCCRVFAPRYRQAHLKAFLVSNSDRAKQALDIAYSDIKNAFQHYLDRDNYGRPIIIASHSQGSYLAIRLLQEYFDDKPLQKQLVCAYLIGWPIEKNKFKTIPVGDVQDATGCVVGWRCYQEGNTPRFEQTETGRGICVNPLTWTTSEERASADLNLGALVLGFNTLYPHAASATIDPKTKVLWVSLPDEWSYKIKNAKSLHIMDYNLFWMNIRKNIKVRIDKYLKNTGAPEAASPNQ